MQRIRTRPPKRKFDKEAERSKAFTPPDWVGKPPAGLHLDVHKSDKLIEKKMIDEKPFYLFGRNADIVDIAVDHASCSRYHAALVYHSVLKRSFIIDLKSTHGTFIGSIRLDPNAPKQLLVDQSIHFGASSRTFTLRERPQGTQALFIQGENKQLQELLGIENEKELDDLTEYNTVHNKRVVIATAGDKTEQPKRRKSENSRISFHDDPIVINPEDIDPTVGKFRNMISSTIVQPNSMGSGPNLLYDKNAGMKNLAGGSMTAKDKGIFTSPNKTTNKLSSYLPVVNSAPEPLDLSATVAPSKPELYSKSELEEPEPKRKKYAKESWPGRKQATQNIAPLLF